MQCRAEQYSALEATAHTTMVHDAGQSLERGERRGNLFVFVFLSVLLFVLCTTCYVVQGSTLHCTVLHCTAHCALHFTVLHYYTALHCNPPSHRGRRGAEGDGSTTNRGAVSVQDLYVVALLAAKGSPSTLVLGGRLLATKGVTGDTVERVREVLIEMLVKMVQMSKSKVRCSAVQCSAVQCSAVQCSAPCRA